MCENFKWTNEYLSQLEGVEGLDVEKGVFFCNGEEEYIEILQVCCEDSKKTRLTAEKAFEKQDWKSYIITVHGIKGSMRTIGVMELSELAKQLELAGKEGRIDYIFEHHNELMEKYWDFFSRLQEFEWLCQSEEVLEDEYQELSELQDEEFDKIIADMEDAMFSLDGDALLELITVLQTYQYKGTSLKSLLSPARRKIEMSDYISAVDLIIEEKNKLMK